MTNVTCGVPQGSILGPLILLIFVNDLNKASKRLYPIMFADDTNLFFSGYDIKALFRIVNQEHINSNEWFKANKLLLEWSKTKYVFFDKSSKVDYIPLKLPDLKINNSTTKREYDIKFLGIILDENLTWRQHINITENKISKILILDFFTKQNFVSKMLENYLATFDSFTVTSIIPT